MCSCEGDADTPAAGDDFSRKGAIFEMSMGLKYLTTVTDQLTFWSRRIPKSLRFFLSVLPCQAETTQHTKRKRTHHTIVEQEILTKLKRRFFTFKRITEFTIAETTPFINNYNSFRQQYHHDQQR
jgi:hypothetical protein